MHETHTIPKRPTLKYEKQLWGGGFRIVAGLDEAGRGAWAGPVYAAAVVLPIDNRIKKLLNGVRDSKCMTPLQRDHWKNCIKSSAMTWAVGSATHKEIDMLGILPATYLAMQRALDELLYKPTYLLIDYIQIPSCACPQLPLPKGDCRSLSIASASVLAKTARDAYMQELDQLYPSYGFARNKGYGTAQHRAALAKLRPCPVHRYSFRPIKSIAKDLRHNLIP
ncbi:MAG: ribonuclease HII [Anaerolineaceae bacterium]|nr:ribonuclease HII [Anaerolineaceae bacterium]